MEKTYNLKSGTIHIPVTVDGKDTGRTIDFDPASQEFAEALYCVIDRVSKIHEAKNKEREAATDILAKFEINRAEDKEMRVEVDRLFGDGFCDDTFPFRLFTVYDGMTQIEHLLFSILDDMDESITENMAKRDANIRKYTDKYRKYRK